MRVGFINHKVKNCGIYQYGKRLYDILKGSETINYIYQELDRAEDYILFLKNNPDVKHVIFNWGQTTMPWIENLVVKKVESIGILHEYTSKAFFDVCCYASTDQDVNSIPRPLVSLSGSLVPPERNECSDSVKNFIEYKEENVPIFGSFGFGGFDKGFQDIVSLVNGQYERAIIKLVITLGEFIPNAREKAEEIIQECKRRNIKNGIKLMTTTEFFSEGDIMKFLSSNTMNMFMYHEIKATATSSVLDYAIPCGRPLGITNSGRFRQFYAKEISLSENTIQKCMESSRSYLKNLSEKYSVENCRNFFQNVLCPVSSDTVKDFIKYKDGDRPIIGFIGNKNFETLFDRAKKEYKNPILKIVCQTKERENVIQTCYSQSDFKILLSFEHFTASDITRFREINTTTFTPDTLAKNVKLLVCIAFHYVEKNIRNLKKVLNNIFDNYKYDTHVIVDTNDSKTEEILLPLYPSLEVVVHRNLGHPYLLTWVHRKYMKDNLNKYDLVMYLEDDILVPFHCVVDFQKKLKTMWPTYIPCYRCVEWCSEKQRYIILGDTSPLKITTENLVIHEGKRYVIPSHPHHAFWMLSTEHLKEVINPSFTEPSIPRDSSIYREHAASYCLGPPPFHTHDKNYTGDRFLNKIPLFELDSDNKLSLKCVVHHTPDLYTSINPIPLDEYIVV